MSRILFAPVAAEDLAAIYEYIATHNRVAADAFISQVERRTELLARQPEVGRVRPELRADLRSIAIGRYVLFYRRIDDGIEIVRVLHGMRNIPWIFDEKDG